MKLEMVVGKSVDDYLDERFASFNDIVNSEKYSSEQGELIETLYDLLFCRNIGTCK